MSLSHFDLTLMQLLSNYADTYNELLSWIYREGTASTKEENREISIVVEDLMEQCAHFRSHIILKIFEEHGFSRTDTGEYIFINKGNASCTEN